MTPHRLVLVSGTGTGVGKTWVACRLLEGLRSKGVAVAARKPVQSFGPGPAGACPDGPTDAELLARASGEAVDEVCPRHRWYERAMAPPMAADALGRPPFTVADLVAETVWPDGVEVGVVEAVGGPRSPLAGDDDTTDLARALQPDLVVLVAEPGLGTINAVRLSGAALSAASGGVPLTVCLNRFDGCDRLHTANRAWLADRDGFDVVVSGAELETRVRLPRDPLPPSPGSRH